MPATTTANETMAPTTANTLYYGDNLDILRHHIATESVDLVYLDPPFNSNRNYNVLFREKSGESSPSQIQAFTDTWQWDRNAEAAFDELVDTGPHNVATMIAAMREFVGRNDMMAYLVMMAQRLVELHRVLKPTGSFYLHCDPTASHYLKIVLDTVFGKENFRNEIVWRRTGSHNNSQRFGSIHDTILYYSVSNEFTWNGIKRPYMKGHVKEHFVSDEKGIRTNYYGNVLTGSGTRNGESGRPWQGFDPTAKSRHWAVPGAVVADMLEAGITLDGLSQHQKLDKMLELGYITITTGQAWPIYQRYIRETDGLQVGDIWAFQPYTEGVLYGTNDGIDADVRWLAPKDQERLGYPTQKPLALLERIISASSNPGDVVLDPFCGCGTAVVAAQKLGRAWVGIDITHLSIALMKNRLDDLFGPAVSYAVQGEPEDLGSATMLAEQDRYQFQWWAASLVNAQPVEGREKKGADRGIDGVIRFVDDAGGKLKRVLVQIKSGHVSSATMRDLVGTLNREGAEMAMLVTLEPSTQPMRQEGIEAGTYHSEAWNRSFPRVQIVTIAELLAGQKADVPPMRATFERAQRLPSVATHAQPSLLAGPD